MGARTLPPLTTQEFVKTRMAATGGRTLAKEAGLSRPTLAKVAAGLPVSAHTLAALARIAPRVRDGSEFRGLPDWRPPARSQGLWSWSLPTIHAARAEQMRGSFVTAARLAESLRTDDAGYNAYHARIAPQIAVATELVACESTRGASVANAAASSVFVSKSVLQGIHGTMANHGVAFGYVVRETNDEGTRVDMKLIEWPIEFVRWNETKGLFETAVKDGGTQEIHHGDGFWVVFAKFKDKPYLQEAAIIPGSFVWAAHATGLADWAAASKSHGLAKFMGELPAGVVLKNADGTLTAEADMFLKMLADIANGESPVGLRPSGSKTDVLVNGSTAWQVFDQLVMNREKAFARIYLRTDAILGSTGDAPGVDISQLFKIASTVVQGDLWAIEQALNTGLYQPWAAINFGSSRYAPAFKYRLPDPDAIKRAEEQHAKRLKLLELVKEYRSQGFDVTQEIIDKLAKEIGVEDPPKLAPVAERAVPLALAPTDVAKVVRVREARAAQGLAPFGDPRDDLTIAQLEAQAAAAAQPPAAPAAPAAPVA